MASLIPNSMATRSYRAQLAYPEELGEESMCRQFTACTSYRCGILTALRAPCLLRTLVASQLLASRALVASQLVRFVDSAVPASWDMTMFIGDTDAHLCSRLNCNLIYNQGHWCPSILFMQLRLELMEPVFGVLQFVRDPGNQIMTDLNRVAGRISGEPREGTDTCI